jgi:FkbM family methyltransferase
MFMSKVLRPVLNKIRELNKIPTIEKFLTKKTDGKNLKNIWTKFLPPLASYKRGSIRSVVRNGIRYELDISDYVEYVIYFGLDVEPKHALYKSISDGMNVFDIGTNMGETLLNFSKLNHSGKNYGFEPVPFLFEKAKKNIGLNGFRNIYLNNLAISDKKGALYFEMPANRNFGSINMSLRQTTNSKEVKAVTFDEFVESHRIDKIDFIKIDVEGFEYKVLQGAVMSIQKFKPLLFIELIDGYLKKNGNSASQLVNFVSDLGYDVFDADDMSLVNVSSDFSKVHIDILCKPKVQ